MGEQLYTKQSRDALNAICDAASDADSLIGTDSPVDHGWIDLLNYQTSSLPIEPWDKLVSPHETIALDDLPRYSPWPARLLSVTPWKPPRKTTSEIIREYDEEKWGALLEQIGGRSKAQSIDEVDRLFFGTEDVACSIRDRLVRMSAIEARLRHVNLVAKAVADELPSEGMVELGSGYGSIVLGLAQRGLIERRKVMAFDFTPSGVAITKEIAKRMGQPITTGHCDLRNLKVLGQSIPPDLIVLTVFSIHCIPRINAESIDIIRSWKPKVVVHFEPIYQLQEQTTLLGLMRRRYIEFNGYNTNLLPQLQRAESRGKLKIVSIEPNLLGANPLLPGSIVKWVPT